jgi:hypothetical protein
MSDVIKTIDNLKLYIISPSERISFCSLNSLGVEVDHLIQLALCCFDHGFSTCPTRQLLGSSQSHTQPFVGLIWQCGHFQSHLPFDAFYFSSHKTVSHSAQLSIAQSAVSTWLLCFSALFLWASASESSSYMASRPGFFSWEIVFPPGEKPSQNIVLSLYFNSFLILSPLFSVFWYFFYTFRWHLLNFV